MLLTAKLDDSSLIPGTHIVEIENHPHHTQVVLCPPHMLYDIYTLALICKINQNDKKLKR